MVIPHYLTEDDPNRRFKFHVVPITQNPYAMIFTCITDECYSYGRMNNQNVRYGLTKIPLCFLKLYRSLTYGQKFLRTHMVGPIFLAEILTGPFDFGILQNGYQPQDSSKSKLISNHRYVPTRLCTALHYSRPFRKWPNDNYPAQGIGRRSTLE